MSGCCSDVVHQYRLQTACRARQHRPGRGMFMPGLHSAAAKALQAPPGVRTRGTCPYSSAKRSQLWPSCT